MTEMNEEIDDAVGEISNMIADYATTKITELGKKVKIKLSEAISGKDHVIDHIDSAEYFLAIPFETTKGRFLIEMAVKES